jgi:hypothetical protein
MKENCVHNGNEEPNINLPLTVDKGVGGLTGACVVDAQLGYIPSEDMEGQLGYMPPEDLEGWLGYIPSEDMEELGYMPPEDMVELGYMPLEDMEELGYMPLEDMEGWLGYMPPEDMEGQLRYMPLEGMEGQLGYEPPEDMEPLEDILANVVGVILASFLSCKLNVSSLPTRGASFPAISRTVGVWRAPRITPRKAIHVGAANKSRSGEKSFIEAVTI